VICIGGWNIVILFSYEEVQMSINKFLISDASYSYNHKCAGLGVLDLYSGKKYRDSLVDIQSSETAEYRALLLSVRIALKNNYEDGGVCV